MQAQIFSVDLTPLQNVMKEVEKIVQKTNPDDAKIYLIMNSATQKVMQFNYDKILIDENVPNGIVDVR